jgi:hypothetical protein
MEIERKKMIKKRRKKETMIATEVWCNKRFPEKEALRKKKKKKEKTQED